MHGHAQQEIKKNTKGKVLKQYAQNVGMASEDEKVHLVLAMNQDTLSHLDAYITMHGGEKIAHLETIQVRLH